MKKIFDILHSNNIDFTYRSIDKSISISSTKEISSSCFISLIEAGVIKIQNVQYAINLYINESI